MDKAKKSEIMKYLVPKDLDGNVKVTHLLSEITQEFIKKHHNDPVKNQRESDARILIQMVHSKIRHLIELSKGINIVDNALSEIIDPSVQYIISRNIFETVVFFNILYIHHKNNREKILIYDLWKLSSLKYRQRLFPELIQEAKELKQEEKQQIETLTNKIKSSNIYSTGNIKTTGQIDIAIRKKKFWTLFENGEVNTSYGPQKLCDKITNQNRKLKDQYTRYSLYTHPSNETVNVFRNIFTDEQYKLETKANLRITNCLIAMFLCDYVKLFPNCKDTFELMPIENQIVCSWNNMFIRDESSSINKSYEKLDE